MLRTTAGRLALNEALPEDLRDYGRQLDRSSWVKLLRELALRHPEQYRDVTWKLAQLARRAVYRTGAFSFGLEHLATPPQVRALKGELQLLADAVAADPRLSDREKDRRVVELTQSYQGKIQQAAYEAARDQDSPLYHQVASGAKGSKNNLSSLIGADLLYVDHRDNPVPKPVLRSYSEGLTPAEYFASANGARRSVTDVKLGVANAGFAAKQLAQATHRLVVTEHDDPKHHDPAMPRGLPVATDDPDNEGAVLAHDAGPYRRGTVLTSTILGDLSARGQDQILVRSPAAGPSPAAGGLYAADLGHREKGGFPARGEFVGLAAGQALCLAAGTPVRMGDGAIKPVEEVLPGEWVLGVSPDGAARPARVLGRSDNGPRPCVETAFRAGQGRSAHVARLASTAGHKVLLARPEGGARSTRNARPEVLPAGDAAGCPVGQVAAVSPSSYLAPPGAAREPLALAVGMALGSPLRSGAWVRLAEESAEEADLALAACGCRLLATRRRDDFYKVAGEPGRKNPLRQALRRLGLYGVRAADKCLPDTSGWDRPSCEALACGLVLSAGKVWADRGGRVRALVSFRSCRLADQARWLLHVRLGVPAPPLLRREVEGGSVRYQVLFDARDDVRRLAVALRLPGPQGRLLELAYDYRPRVADVSVPHHFPLLYQRPLGELPTHDLHIDHPDHLFLLANGLVVSNSEPLTQSGLSSKHTGGVAGAGKALTGFKAIDTLMQHPAGYAGWAAHAAEDGRVTGVRGAPQGGHYVSVSGKDVHVPAGQEVLVKPGEEVEAGDALSGGLPNPAEVITHKGIGEGRRYLTQALVRAYRDSGMPVHRRNAELVARGLADHVRLTGEHGPYVPDDVIPYSALESTWEPREGHRELPPDEARGHYLERPVLHHTLGTRLTPKVIAELRRFGVRKVLAHPEPPPFVPEPVRGMEVLSHDPDWLTRFLGSYVEKNFLRGVHRGHTSSEETTSYVPQLARGVGFGHSPHLFSPEVPPVPGHLRRPPDRARLLEEVLPGDADLDRLRGQGP